MDLLKEVVRDKTPANLLMIAAIVVLLVSQFFLYLNDPGSGVLTNATNTDYYTDLVITSPTQVGTGWELHPHAYIILIVLAFAFLRDDVVSSPLFSRYGWWASLVLVVAATAPGAYFRNAPGAMLGGIAVLVALAAVILHLREVRRVSPKNDANKPGGAQAR